MRVSSGNTDGRRWAPAIAKGTFLVLTLLLFIMVVYILRSVLHAIVLGVLFAMLLLPMYTFILKWVTTVFEWLARRFPRRKVSLEYPAKRLARIERRNRSIASMLSIVVVVVVIVVPLWLFAANLVHQGYETTLSAQTWIKNELPAKMHDVIERYKLQEKLDRASTLYRQLGSGDMFRKNVPAAGSPAAAGSVAEEAAAEGEEAAVAVPADGVKPSAAEVPEAKAEAAAEVPEAKAEAATEVSEAKAEAAAEVPDMKVESVKSGEPEEAGSPAAKIGPLITELAGKVMGWLRGVLLGMLSKVGVLIFNFCVMLFVMYQFFFDGPAIWAYLKSISPLSDDAQRQVGQRVKEVSRAVFFGIFGTALLQGACACLVFYLAGIPVFWGVVLGICSIIPLVGTSIIWVPVVFYLFFIGAYAKAVFIFIACGCVIANFDMMLRPLLMKKSGETGMSYMVLFLSILGGIQTFGLVGLLYGPLITGICSICLFIFSTQFKYARGEGGAAVRKHGIQPPKA